MDVVRPNPIPLTDARTYPTVTLVSIHQLWTKQWHHPTQYTQCRQCGLPLVRWLYFKGLLCHGSRHLHGYAHQRHGLSNHWYHDIDQPGQRYSLCHTNSKPHLLYRSQWHDKPGYYFQYTKINILWSTGENTTQLNSKGRHLLLHSHRCSWLCCNRQCHYCQCSGLSWTIFYAVPRQLQTQWPGLAHPWSQYGKHNLFMGQCSLWCHRHTFTAGQGHPRPQCAHGSRLWKKIPPFW